MKIRTITTGFNVSNSLSTTEKKGKQFAKDTQKIKDYLEQQGYTVQTIRLSTQPWESFASTKTDLFNTCQLLQSLCPKEFDYFNIGPISSTDHISLVPDFLKTFPQGFCTVNLIRNNNVQTELAYKTAQQINTISTLEKQGFANLRFAALCHVTANTPFYPASFHQGPPSFGIGCENGDVIANIFSSSQSYEEAHERLFETLNNEYQQIEKLAIEASEQTRLKFHGIDASISPSVHPNESLVYGIEKLPFVDTFGSPGSLSAARLITSVLQDLSITQCGYTGLMLPVMEDSGLARRNKEGKLSLTKLLLYSSVCGTGLDTIPLPGDISVETLYGILFDVASLSEKLHKPLSARLMPIPNKKAGDFTEFDFEYFENTTVMNP